MSSLTLVAIVSDYERIERLLEWAGPREVFTEIKLFVDDRTRLAMLPSTRRMTVERIKIKNLDSAFAYVHSTQVLKTDWALHLGDDELMGEWFDEDIETLMAAPYDVYSFRRYNVCTAIGDSDRITDVRHIYISTSPWYPDWCQRLFRPGHIVHNGEVHEGPQVDGRLSMARPHVFHFDFVDQSPAVREKKWETYLKQGVVEASRKRGVEDDYYKRWCLPEEYEYEISSCQEGLAWAPLPY